MNEFNYFAIPSLKGAQYAIREKLKTVAEIERVVLDWYGLDRLLILGKRRTRNIVEARHIIMFLTRKYCGLTFESIGELYNRDHTSVLHAIKTVGNLMETDELFLHTVKKIETRIY